MPYTFYVAAHALYHDTDAPVVALQLGEVGFWPIQTRARPDALNERGPLPLEVEESALAASVVGWDAPIAQAARDYAAGFYAPAQPTQGE